MSYTDPRGLGCYRSHEEYRGGETGDVGAALAVVGLSAERAAKEVGSGTT